MLDEENTYLILWSPHIYKEVLQTQCKSGMIPDSFILRLDSGLFEERGRMEGARWRRRRRRSRRRAGGGGSPLPSLLPSPLALPPLRRRRRRRAKKGRERGGEGGGEAVVFVLRFSAAETSAKKRGTI